MRNDTIKTPLVLEIRGNSLDDGPGIRSVVFFKGCPLSCAWCHNPESKSVHEEIAYDARECVGCDTCIPLCGRNALSRKNAGFIDRKKCDLCFACAQACPSGALARVGREMSVGEITEALLRDKPFYDTSGGGVTLSGGEPALFIEFVSALLAMLRKKRVHTLIETSGFFDYSNFAQRVLSNVDAIYFDIKLIDESTHWKYAGVPNARILENFRRLLADAARAKVELLPRTPLVPGITDTDSNLTGIADFLAGLGVKKAALMQYNPLWHDKAAKIGAADRYANDPAMGAWMDKQNLRRCRDIFKAKGIET
ncbi:MAG: glycyl-radical enzyme activating protein [Spirochaetes bacterium]|nr:MAG: glycyl-radical enzyme activating protein [Spirochaetota bacterium]